MVAGDLNRICIYSRVSTKEQAEGYSIADQVRELSRYAEANDHQVVDTLTDDGYSATDLNRPGLLRALELAQAGQIDAIVATKRDRLFRSRYHRLMFEEDLRELGVQLIALNDPGHKIAEGVMDDYSEWERQQILERTLKGKREKARQAKVVGNNVAAYGFQYGDGQGGYVVDPETAPVVRRIFQAVADGDSIYSLLNALNAEGVPAPRSNHSHKTGQWSRAFIRQAVLNDLYRPHSYSELQRLVRDGNLAADVLDRLDKDKRYGISWAGRKQVQTYYKGREKKKRTVDAPRKDWIAVPVPDLGVPRTVVDRARDRLNENRPPSKASSRDFWELSGGIVRCAECGLTMNPRMMKPRNREFYYYHCHQKFRETGPECNHSRNYPAQDLEYLVADWISELLAANGGLIQAIDAALQVPDTAEQDAAAIRQHLTELDQERDGYLRQNARGILTDSELDGYLAEIEDKRRQAEDRLNQLTEGLSRIERLRQHKEQLLREYDDWALRGLSPQDRHATYKRLGIKVFIGPDGMTTELDGVTVRWQPFTVTLDGTTVYVSGLLSNESHSSADSVPIGDP
jgi:DNA invertase Pin-like site-specific DNA recombinase